MSFALRPAPPEEGDAAPVIGRFTDEEWWNLTALAHECGFDAGREHERLVYPDESDTRELDTRLAQQLYIDVSAVKSRDVLPFATTWEEDDGHIHFRWVEPPEYGGDHAPAGQGEAGEGSNFQIKGATLDRLMEYLTQGSIRITRVASED